MNYDRINWVNDGPPSINAANLNHMDAGIKAAHDALADSGTSGTPPGGTTGQALVKASDIDHDVTWGDVVGGGESGTTDHAALTNRDAADQHPIGSVTGLQSALDGKAPAMHGHTIADVEYLQIALNNKAEGGHTHTAAQISDATTTGRAVMQASSATAARTAIGAQSAIPVYADETAVMDALGAGQIAVGDIVGIESP